MKERSRIIEIVALLAVVILIAGLTHFTAILLLPNVATKDAYSLLALKAQAKERANGPIVLLAPSKPGDTLIPFRDPATIQGLCFYDLRKAPVRIRVKTEDERLLTLSFRTPDGRVFYSMTDRAALNNVIDIRLVTDAQLKTVEDTDDEDQGIPSELRLKSPSPQGLMVVTALITRPSEAREATDRVKAISCAPEPLPPPS